MAETIQIDLEKWINSAFTFHELSDDARKKCETIRDHATALAKTIALNCPQSGEQMFALRMVQMASMWANAAISMH